MSVYFIQEENDGLIKIGYSRNPNRRLKSLQTNNPRKLRILKVIDGEMCRETYLHHRCSKFNASGEWFHPHPELIDYIDMLGDDYSPEDCVIRTQSWRIPLPVLQHAKAVAKKLGYGSWQHLIMDCFLNQYPLPKEKD